ncbi:deaminase, partial [Klebsiella pneumoniae]|nr:deaminase [Klebsiella pneumoniae]
VLLETGFEYDGDGNVTATKTALFSIQIANGKIKNISANSNSVDAIDAKGLLMLPSFKDMHIHLDKTYYGDKWQAVRRGPGGVKG